MTLTSSLSVHQGIAALCMAALLSMDLAATAHAQSAPIVYPSAGQSMDQQGRDEAECRNWATQQTGMYPNQAPPAYYGNSYQQGAPVVRGAARGAALGAVGGAIGGDAGKGAAIGAGVGALIAGPAGAVGGVIAGYWLEGPRVTGRSYRTCWYDRDGRHCRWR